MNQPPETETAAAGVGSDAYFVLDECSALFRRRMSEVARKEAALAPSVTEAFAAALGEAHDELASDKQRDGFEQTAGLTASRITLMGEADLELDIRIGDLCRRLMNVSGSNHWRVHLRYVTLLNRPEMSPEINPVGADAIASGLWAICRAGDISHERKLDLLNRLEEAFIAALPGIYDELNDLLASHKVEPAPSRIANAGSAGGNRAGAGGPSGEAYWPSGAGGARIDPFSALQQAMAAQFGGMAGMTGTAGNFGGGTNFGTGDGAPRHGMENAGNMALGAATLVMLNQLAARLDQWQRSGQASGAISGNVAADGAFAGGSNELPESAPRAFKAADLDLPLGNPEAIALETLGQIFEAIFKTWDLPDSVKMAISRLQIPLLKLSVFDPSLFSDPMHPARQLINAMGRAAVGLPRNIDRTHPVPLHLWNIASTVAETLQKDPEVLAAPLAALDALIVERDEESREAAQAFIPTLAQAETQNVAAQLADRWLREVEREPSAREIHDFIRQFWVKVMAAAAAEGGEDGSFWRESKATIDDLMWSVRPKPDAEERKRLSTLVATLIKRINGGLDRVGVTQEERAPFLDACFNLQFATMRGHPPPLLVPPPRDENTADAGTASAASTEFAVSIEDVRGKPLKKLARSSGGTSIYRASASGAQVGQWVQFLMEGGEIICGLVAWIGPQSGTLLLANSEWPYAVAVTEEVMEKQMKRGQATVVSSRALFDMAAEQALSQIARG